MTEKWKASQALKYMEDELDAKTILQVLNPYLKDEQLAEVFDRLVDDGTISPTGIVINPIKRLRLWRVTLK